ncbi:MAG: hypothetical protein K0R78_873 [Pelosinus sp.]|jgi:hypothetical protein|nr:hypothetical protein [Pelosinus sp.]
MKKWLLEHKRILLISLSIICVLLLLWQVFASKIRQDVQDTLIQRISQQINGQLSVGTVDLSWSGRIRIQDVSLYDQQGSLLAQIPVIKMKYRWSDLTEGSLGMPQIETVILERGELWFKEDNNHFNWDDLLKKDQNETTTFRSKVELEDGKIHIETALFSQVLENSTGIIDWQNNPNMTINLKGKIDQSVVDVNGQWGENLPGDFKIQIDTLDIVKFNKLFAGTEYSLEGGTVRPLLINVQQDTKGTLHYQAEGSFSGVTMNGKMKIEEGQGKFSTDGTKIALEDLKLLIAGQSAQGQGNISWNNGVGMLDFAFTLPDADPAAFMSGITVARPLVLQVHVNGSVSEPNIGGSFSFPQISFSNMTVDSVTGNFRYTGNKVMLQQVQGSAYQGTLAASGTVVTENQSYELDVSGQGLNSSQLTDKDVQGPLAFNGHVSGKGEAAVTRGNFAIHDGKTYGLAFQKMTGLFVKNGNTTDISAIAIQTAYGTIYPEQLSQEALERLKLQDIPVSKGEIKRVVTDKLLEKLLR